MTPLAQRLAEAFWPGPLTLVLTRRAGSKLSELVSAGLDTVAIRVPDHPVAQALLRAAECPLAAPSANRSGRLSPTRAAHVYADFGDGIALILDGGPTAHGLESTVIDARGEEPVLLRPGAVPAETMEAVIEMPLRRAIASTDTPSSPGQLASHYAPRATLRLDAKGANPDEALLAFGPDVPAGAARTINLSPTGDLIEAAANLFAALHALDDGQVDSDRRHADPRARARRGDQRQAAARGGAAQLSAREVSGRDATRRAIRRLITLSGHSATMAYETASDATASARTIDSPPQRQCPHDLGDQEKSPRLSDGVRGATPVWIDVNSGSSSTVMRLFGNREHRRINRGGEPHNKRDDAGRSRRRT